MALTDENGGNGMVMPVQPMYGGGYGNGGFGFGGDSWAWIILVLLLGGNGWGFGGWGGMMGMGMMDGMMLYPWMNQAEITTQGFQNQQLSTQINGVQNAVTSGFGDTALGIAGINQNICQTGNGITAAINAAQNATAQQLYTNEIASLNRSFAEQSANQQSFNAAQAQLADCCCENRLATANLSALVQSENCADREALSNGIRDIITAQNAGTQRILDVLCQDKIDAKNEKIQELQTQVTMQNLAASQAAQTAQLMQDNTAQTAQLIQRIAPYPVPAFQVGNPYYYNGYNNECCNGTRFN